MKFNRRTTGIEGTLMGRWKIVKIHVECKMSPDLPSYGNELYKSVLAVKIDSITFDVHLIRTFLYMYQGCSMKVNIKILRTKLMSKYNGIATYDKNFLTKVRCRYGKLIDYNQHIPRTSVIHHNHILCHLNASRYRISSELLLSI